MNATPTPDLNYVIVTFPVILTVSDFEGAGVQKRFKWVSGFVFVCLFYSYFTFALEKYEVNFSSAPIPNLTIRCYVPVPYEETSFDSN